jgi:error-prone DNA polymerase
VDAIEQVGLVKIDLLGNRALATVDEARRHAGLTPAMEKAAAGDDRWHPAALRSNPTLALDRDAATVALLQRGETLGITQMESPAMRHLLIQLQPTCLLDVIQSLALLYTELTDLSQMGALSRRDCDSRQ